MCTVYVYTQHNRGHNIVLNRAGFLVWASRLHGSPTMAISWPAFLFPLWDLTLLCVVDLAPKSHNVWPPTPLCFVQFSYGGLLIRYWCKLRPKFPATASTPCVWQMRLEPLAGAGWGLTQYLSTMATLNRTSEQSEQCYLSHLANITRRKWQESLDQPTKLLTALHWLLFSSFELLHFSSLLYFQS